MIKKSFALSLIFVLAISSIAMANIYAPVIVPEVVIPEDPEEGVEVITLTEENATAIQQAITAGATTINLELGAPATAMAPLTKVTVPTSVLTAAKTATVTLKTASATLTLPPALVAALAERGTPLVLEISRPAPAAVAPQAPTGSEVLGQPLSVVTDLTGPTTVTIPFTPGLVLPADAAAREAFLAGLGVFAIHSDDEENTIHGLGFDIDETVTPPVLTGVTFTVDKFSKFALIKLTRDPLTTTIGTRGYTLAGKAIDMQEVYYKGNDTLMPIRMLKDYGVNYAWDEATQTATMSFRDRVVAITVGSPDAWVDGRAFPIIGASGAIVPAELAPGRVMVPLRFVSERLGFDVHWDPTHVITITPR